MADTHRMPTDAVTEPEGITEPEWLEELKAEPWRFEFLQVLRNFECGNGDRPRLGTSRTPSDDPLRLRHEPSMTFAPANVTRYAIDQETSDETVPELWSRFLGLLGPNGPLPLSETEEVLSRLLHDDDSATAAFLDLFHHRMLLLFYRAWAAAQPTVQHDRPDEDRYANHLGAFIGIGSELQSGLDAAPDGLKRHFTGHLTRGPRTAEGLRAILEHHLGVTVRVESFHGRTIELPEHATTQLGGPANNATLGTSAFLGKTVWDRQSHCRVVIGPVDRDLFDRLLPTGSSHPMLRDVLTKYLGAELACDVTLILREDEVPQPRLTSGPERLHGTGARLGLDIWLLGQPSDRDRDDVTIPDETLRRTQDRFPSPLHSRQ